MKNKIIYLLFSVLSFFVFSGTINAQSLDKLTRRCPSPNQSVYASILVQGNGDIRHTPCPSRASIFTGNVDFSGATLTGVVSGSGTTNFIPRWSGASSLTNTPFSWNGTTYAWNNTALNSEVTMEFTPVNGANAFRVGDFTTTPETFINVSPNTAARIVLEGSTANNSRLTVGASTARLENQAGLVQIGSSTDNLQVTSSTDTLSTTLSTWNLAGVSTFNLNRTITPAGTTGDRTINTPAGTVNFAAGSNQVVVTNSLVTANSIILYTQRTADATCTITSVVAGAGIFNINMSANCTAETSVGFFVTN